MIKKRYIIIGAAILMIVFGSVIAYTRPVLPFIQLPGEVYPHTEGLFPEFLFNGTGFTNTFAATLLAWLFVIIIIVALRAGSRTADEVPTGFYNLFEMILEGAYNFAEGIAGPRVREFFPYFMSFILIILLANWSGLIPGFDSIGQWEHKPHFIAEKEGKALKAELEAQGIKPSAEQVEEAINEVVLAVDESNAWGLRDGLFLIRGDCEHAIRLHPLSRLRKGTRRVATRKRRTGRLCPSSARQRPTSTSRWPSLSWPW